MWYRQEPIKICDLYDDLCQVLEGYGNSENSYLF